MATVTKTIGTDSRDYSTITAWEADLDNGAEYSSGDDAVGEIYNDSVFSETPTINGGGTVGLNTITLTVPSSERHDGTAGTGARIVNSGANGLNFATTVSPNVVEWLEVDCGGNFTSYAIKNTTATSAEVLRVTNCIVHNVTHTATNIRAIDINAGGFNKAYNNIVYDCDMGGAASSADCEGIRYGSVDSVDNNTVYKITTQSSSGSSFGNGIKSTLAAACRNNIVMDCTDDDIDVPSGQEYNITSDGSADGVSPQTNKKSRHQFVSIVEGAEDLHITQFSDARGAADDLSTTHNVNIDIDGRDRDAEGDVWDVGAHQFVYAGGDLATVDILFFGASGMPNDDSTETGGEIDLTTSVFFENPLAANDTIDVYSSDFEDSGVLTITGRNSSGDIITEEYNMEGTGVVAGATTFERVLEVSHSGDHYGTVTLEENSGGTTILELPGTYTTATLTSVNKARRMFYDATVDGTVDKDLYEKFFIANYHPNDTLSSATIELSTDSTASTIMDFKLEDEINGSESVADRTTEPTGVIGSWDDTAKNIPDSLSEGDAIGVWVYMDLGKDLAAEKKSISFTITGNT